ncbi:MAG TPA: NgoPII family restriction endonuclease [Candidatus Cloacimonadota bacterium]|nr:NgoPII family restriction endonuclease [Candidatus Cloacimonadota bacterium]
MSNILHAINNISQNPVTELMLHFRGRNRINNVGYALEEYIKDAFAGTINCQDENERILTYSRTFSYIGTQNNPPDFIVTGGDAVEVKKIQSARSGLALNSSYPKSRLHSNDPLITNACRECEQWEEKDIIYAVGHTDDRNLLTLWLVYGDCYAADRQIYERIKNTISQGITAIPDVEFAETNELGRVNRVDPLGITYLRVRGMWGIENPCSVFDYVHRMNMRNRFNMAVIIRQDKFNAFNNDDQNLINNNEALTVTDVLIRNPNNPALLLNSKLITYSIL